MGRESPRPSIGIGNGRRECPTTDLGNIGQQLVFFTTPIYNKDKREITISRLLSKPCSDIRLVHLTFMHEKTIEKEVVELIEQNRGESSLEGFWKKIMGEFFNVWLVNAIIEVGQKFH